jgi:hypothetical protein
MPHLQELVELHKDEPFVLIGVNTGDAPDVYRAGLETYGVSWLSAYQGESSPIANLFNVASYPTYVVIDAEGKISSRSNMGSAVDAVINKLLKETKGGGK